MGPSGGKWGINVPGEACVGYRYFGVYKGAILVRRRKVCDVSYCKLHILDWGIASAIRKEVASSSPEVSTDRASFRSISRDGLCTSPGRGVPERGCIAEIFHGQVEKVW